MQRRVVSEASASVAASPVGRGSRTVEVQVELELGESLLGVQRRWKGMVFLLVLRLQAPAGGHRGPSNREGAQAAVWGHSRHGG